MVGHDPTLGCVTECACGLQKISGNSKSLWCSQLKFIRNQMHNGGEVLRAECSCATAQDVTEALARNSEASHCACCHASTQSWTVALALQTLFQRKHGGLITEKEHCRALANVILLDTPGA